MLGRDRYFTRLKSVEGIGPTGDIDAGRKEWDT